MQKNFLPLICTCFLLSSGYAEDTAAVLSSSCFPRPIPIFEDPLRDILIPDWMVLYRKNLDQGPIAAYEVISNCHGSGVGKGWMHTGHYIEGCITTLVDGKSGNLKFGEQMISMGTEVSRSRDYTIEIICGKKYVVHHHCGFRVYSTATEQFVIAN